MFQPSTESANDKRARLTQEGQARYGGSGVFCHASIVVSPTGGEDIDELYYEELKEVMNEVAIRGVNSMESAPNGKCPHNHIQACWTVRATERSPKLKQILRALIKRRLNLPANANYCVGINILKCPENGYPKGNQSFSLGVGYCLKEHATSPVFRTESFNVTAEQQHRAFIEYSAQNSGSY